MRLIWIEPRNSPIIASSGSDRDPNMLVRYLNVHSLSMPRPPESADWLHIAVAQAVVTNPFLYNDLDELDLLSEVVSLWDALYHRVDRKDHPGMRSRARRFGEKIKESLQWV